ncbi:unnamed protein product [Phytophthora fragariaefolia]|uniref:Unnamed protein product n=1 Tax=Phytophthora fragariaefolia TaxID=1490495 RepID=A0A9W6YF96_9STRA|nr:unnamed protein product [Phytophthora fragariaefolia]
MEEPGLSSGELKSVKTLIKTRFDFVYGDAHDLAYLLDPRYAGKGMDMLTRTAVEEFLGAKRSEHLLKIEILPGFDLTWKLQHVFDQ